MSKTFQKSPQYWDRKIRAIEIALGSIERMIPGLTEERQIIAHEECLKTLKKELAKAHAGFAAWQAAQGGC
jgi:hypothetical protein